VHGVPNKKARNRIINGTEKQRRRGTRLTGPITENLQRLRNLEGGWCDLTLGKG